MKESQLIAEALRIVERRSSAANAAHEAEIRECIHRLRAVLTGALSPQPVAQASERHASDCRCWQCVDGENRAMNEDSYASWLHRELRAREAVPQWSVEAGPLGVRFSIDHQSFALEGSAPDVNEPERQAFLARMLTNALRRLAESLPPLV